VTDLREAVGLLSGSPAVLEAARAQLSLGRSPEVGDTEAVTLLQAALDTARACGARAVVRDAAAALVQRGQAPVDADAAPVGITTRQRRVAELTAAGLDVNVVAQRLFLTPGTVRAVLDSTTDSTTEAAP
jgi:DNA-binding NarL/FixJ family response regulator